MLDSCVAKQPRTAANRRRTRASCERLGHRCTAAGLVKFWGNPGDIHGSSRRAVAAVDEVRQSSIREVQQLAPARTEPTAGEFAAKDEIAAAISARWQEEMEKHRVHAEELTQRLASQAAELKRELDRCEEFLEAMNSELEPRAEARLNEAVARAASEFDGAAARAIERRY